MLLTRFFFGKIYLPSPFNIYFDFYPLFRIILPEFSRKYPFSQTPAINRGCIEGKTNTRGLGIWLSQSLLFGNLAIIFGIYFLNFRKILLGNNKNKNKDIYQNHKIWLSRSLAFGSSAIMYKGRNYLKYHTGN